MLVKYAKPFDNIIQDIKEVAVKHNYKAYVVGGFVRDMLLGVESSDLDILVDSEDMHPATAFTKLLEEEGKASNRAIYENYGTAKVDMHGMKVEFVMPRGERYKPDSRKPEVHKVDIHGDAIRRDFTINTLMIDIMTNEIIDPTSYGLEDLQCKILRSANPEIGQMFTDDALRILRAIRFMACKGFTPLDSMLEAMEKFAPRLSIISKERIRDELNKILLSDKPSTAFRVMGATKVLDKVIPEMLPLMTCMESPPYHWDESSFEHTMRVLDNVEPKLLLRVAALLHDISKPETRTVDEKGSHFYDHQIKGAFKAENIMRTLCYSNDEIKIVHKLIFNHLRPHFYRPNFTDRAVRKYIYDMGDLLEDSMALAYADTKGSSPEKYEQKGLKNLDDMKERIKVVMAKPLKFKPLVNGEEICKVFNEKPGPYIGQVLKYVLELQLENNEITKEQVLEKLKSMNIVEIQEVIEKVNLKDSQPWNSKLHKKDLTQG